MVERRRLLGFLPLAALLPLAQRASAQTYPARPVRLIVGYPPGGQSDLTARLVARCLGGQLGAPMVVENRPGAGGTIGADAVIRAPADGYTLLVSGGNALTLAPALDSSVHINALRDLAPIARVARVPLVLIARADLPVATLPELIALARRQPDRLTYASGATIVQVAFEALGKAQGLQFVHVPYSGSAPAIIDVAAGRVDLGLVDVAVVAPHVKTGRIKILAVAGASRTRAFPDVQTGAEQGVADFVWESWAGVLAPAGTPPEVIGRLKSALMLALETTECRDGLASLGFDPVSEPADEIIRVLRDEATRFRRVIDAAGLRVSR